MPLDIGICIDHTQISSCISNIRRNWESADTLWGIYGWGSPLPLFSYFFFRFWIHTLAIGFHVHIWQVSPHLSCFDTCQIWMWLKRFKMFFAVDILSIKYLGTNCSAIIKIQYFNSRKWAWKYLQAAALLSRPQSISIQIVMYTTLAFYIYINDIYVIQIRIHKFWNTIDIDCAVINNL